MAESTRITRDSRGRVTNYTHPFIDYDFKITYDINGNISTFSDAKGHHFVKRKYETDGSFTDCDRHSVYCDSAPLNRIIAFINNFYPTAEPNHRENNMQ